jgi:pimeloyl-ACP methyl ester carboxylesterase
VTRRIGCVERSIGERSPAGTTRGNIRIAIGRFFQVGARVETATLPPVPTISANGIDLYYERLGSGPRLLLFNGSGSSIENSRPVIEAFAGQFDVAVHDQRGLGRTEVPEPPYEMADYAADAAALLDHLGWDTCRAAGISFGGMVAQEFAVTWPERVQRLALMCTSPGGPNASSYPLHELDALPDEERIATGLRILDSRFDANWFADHPSDRGLAEMMAQRRAAPKTDEQRRGEAAQLDARSRHDVVDRLGRISCPTFVAAGRYDGIAPAANAEIIVGAVPDAELHLYEGGHAFFAQDPAAFPDVLRFLGG